MNADYKVRIEYDTHVIERVVWARNEEAAIAKAAVENGIPANRIVNVSVHLEV